MLEVEILMDSQVTDAIYSGGVLKPLGDVSLHESERVRLIIERKDLPSKNGSSPWSGFAPA